MTVNRTTLLDLPLPVTGTESGTWGDTTNNGLTQYMDIAIAGMSNLTSANFTTGALTIETTEGDSTATNISATSAQYAGFRVTSLAQNSTITVGNTGTNPARSYRLINADATYTLTFKATGQTGITLQPGQTAVVAFNGTDYVIVGMAGAGTVTDNAVVRFDGTTGKLVQNSVVTIADSTGDISGAGSITSTSASGILTRAAATQDGVELIGRAGGSSSYKVTLTPTTLGGNRTLTLPDTTGTVALTGSTVASFSAGSTGFTPNSATTGAVTLGGTLATTNGGTGLTSFTANGVVYASSSSALTTGSALTFDGTNLGVGTSTPINIGAGYTSITTNGSTGGGVVFSQSNTQKGAIFSGSNNVYVDVSNSAGNLYLRNTSTTAITTLDSSGNLGLGVTPSAWLSSYRSIAVSYAGSAISSDAVDKMQIGSNFYRSSTADTFAGTGYATLYQQASGLHKWFTSTASGTAGNAITFSQVMTLDASGNFSVATTSALARTTILSDGSAKAVGVIGRSSDNASTLDFWNNAGSTRYAFMYADAGGPQIGAVGALPIAFYTNSTERARITSLGYFKASNTGTYSGGSTSQAHTFDQSVDNNALLVYQTNATLTTSGIVFIEAARNTTNNTFYALSYYNSGAAAYKFRVADSGDVTNTNNSYAGISDLKLKQDIVDASSQWDDIKNLRVRKYRLKSDPSMSLHIGLVAQEAELVSPGLVDEHTDRDAENNDLGTKTKSVKYSILYMKAIKALQEAMTRIETLEAKVAQLEGTQP